MSVHVGVVPGAARFWWVEKLAHELRDGEPLFFEATKSQAAAFAGGRSGSFKNREVNKWRLADGSTAYQTNTVEYNDDDQTSGYVINDKTGQRRKFVSTATATPPRSAETPSPYEGESFHIVKAYTFEWTTFCAVRGSVVFFQGDAIVNAANTGCLGGGGIDGVISEAGGRELAEARQRLPVLNQQGDRCAEGDAVLTAGRFGSLKARMVVHAVGPNFNSAPSREEGYHALERAYARALSVACIEGGAESVAFPLISASIFRGREPLEDVLYAGIKGAANVAATLGGTRFNVLRGEHAPKVVAFCAYTEPEENALVAAFERFSQRKTVFSDATAVEAIEESEAKTQAADKHVSKKAEGLRAENGDTTKLGAFLSDIVDKAVAEKYRPTCYGLFTVIFERPWELDSEQDVERLFMGDGVSPEFINAIAFLKTNDKYGCMRAEAERLKEEDEREGYSFS